MRLRRRIGFRRISSGFCQLQIEAKSAELTSSFERSENIGFCPLEYRDLGRVSKSMSSISALSIPLLVSGEVALGVRELALWESVVMQGFAIVLTDRISEGDFVEPLLRWLWLL